MKVRTIGIVLFTLVLLYGVKGFLGLSGADIRAALIWGAAGLVLHDAVFAPIVLGTGALLARKGRALSNAAVLMALTGGVVLLATFPTWSGREYVSDEPGLLEQPYLQNVLAVVVVTLLLGAFTYLRTRRRGQDREEGA